MVTHIQYKREGQLPHYYQWWRAENLANSYRFSKQIHVYMWFVFGIQMQGELYGTYKPNENNFDSCLKNTKRKL